MHDQDAETDPSPETQDNNGSEDGKFDDGRERTSKDYTERQIGRDGDMLAWIEGPAFSSPIEEMPTLQWPDDEEGLLESDAAIKEQNAGQMEQSPEVYSTAEESEGDEIEDAMTWLEQLAAGQGTPLDEMPTLVSGDNSLTADADEVGTNMGEVPGRTTVLEDIDSDPMAWLEQLAVDQSSPLEELPSVADRLLASEIISQNDVDSAPVASAMNAIPISLMVEEALTYLEQLAASGGIDLDEVELEQVESYVPDEVDLGSIDKLSKVAVAGKLLDKKVMPEADYESQDAWSDLAGQIPDDPDDALAWLSNLSDEEPEIGPEQDLSADSKQADLAKQESPLGIDTLDKMPDDPDEAMAWMQRLADDQEETSDSSRRETVPEPQLGNEFTNMSVQGESNREATIEPSQIDLGSSDRLALARASIAQGDIDQATNLYETILESERDSTELVAELEDAVNTNPDSRELVKLLGDAYMQSGQLQKALSTYRKGFDHT